MTEQETFQWGDKAQTVLDSPEYQDLFEHITTDLTKGILASDLSEEQHRNDLFLTYHGMRFFHNCLTEIRGAKDKLINAQEAGNTDPDEDQDY